MMKKCGEEYLDQKKYKNVKFYDVFTKYFLKYENSDLSYKSIKI